ncbi:MAG: hypothetical protein AAF499_19955, partial [Pseudomonadota bacterium]
NAAYFRSLLSVLISPSQQTAPCGTLSCLRRNSPCRPPAAAPAGMTADTQQLAAYMVNCVEDSSTFRTAPFVATVK